MRRDNLGLFGSRWMPRFSVYMPRANRFQKFSCWLKLPNMTEWQFTFQMWDGVLPDPWDYEHLRVPPDMRVEDLLPICVDHAFLQTIWRFSEVLQPCGDRERLFPGARHTRNHLESACKGGVSVRGEVNSDCKNPW